MAEKPAIAFGLRYRAPEPEYGLASYSTAIRITSFKRNRKGTIMAYGTDLRTGLSTSRTAESIDHYYDSKEKLDRALLLIDSVVETLDNGVAELQRQLRDAQRGRKIEINRVLGRRAIQPHELEQLQ